MTKKILNTLILITLTMAICSFAFATAPAKPPSNIDSETSNTSEIADDTSIVSNRLGIAININYGTTKKLSNWIPKTPKQYLGNYLFKLSDDYSNNKYDIANKSKIIFGIAEGVGIVVPSKEKYLFSVRVLKGRAGHQKYFRADKYAKTGDIVTYELYSGSDSLILGAPKDGDIVIWFPMTAEVNTYGWLKVLEPENREQVISAINNSDMKHASQMNDRINDTNDCFTKGSSFYNKKKYKSALEWFRKGASKGDIFCSYGLGKMYIEGRGVPVDLMKGLKYLEKPAQTGHVLSLELYCKHVPEEYINGTEFMYKCMEVGVYKK